MTENFESIRNRIDGLYQGDTKEFRRLQELGKFLFSCVEMSNRMGTDVSAATYTNAGDLSATNKPKTERELFSIKEISEILNDIVAEFSRVNNDRLSQVEEKLQQIGGNGLNIR